MQLSYPGGYYIWSPVTRDVRWTCATLWTMAAGQEAPWTRAERERRIGTRHTP